MVALGIISAGSLFAYFAKDLPNPDRLLNRDLSQTTKIYDRTGETVLYEIHGDENRTIVELDAIPDFMEKATISIEDKDFYKHHGFDAFGILRAIIKDVATGQRAQGGSTITQQFIKNAVLTNEKTFTRKIKELILSIEIEQRFSKDEILKLYLNEIPYGSGAYGVESAARTYFGKPAKDLEIAEAAYLASLPKAPTYYSPFGSHRDALDNRKDIVLEQMREQGYITQEQYDDAKDDKPTFIESREDILAPHFVFYVREQLEQKYGQTQVETGGLKVITTLDLGKQKVAEEEIKNHVALINSRGASNAALVSIVPHTGEIVAMVGSIDYYNKAIEGNVNVTTRLRQAGSSFKPYAYAAAFEKGYTPQTKVFDVKTDFGNGYVPENYSHDQNGPIALESALPRSLNIPAVKVGYLVGDANVAAFARRLGISDLPENADYGLATPLGVREIKLLEHTNAFGVFANQGKYNKPSAILKVEDPKGKVLEELKPENKDVLDANIANTMNRILSTNSLRAPTFGTRNSLTLSDRPVAAKTGTTNDFKDALTVGYTPNLVTGVWVGNNSGKVMSSGADGSIVAAPIWHGYMQRALQGSAAESFVAPQPLPAPNATLQGKFQSVDKVFIDSPTGKLWTENCPAENKKEVSFGEIHEILHYVDKSNPKGGAPKNPKADPQYERWEKPVQAWAAKKGYKNEKPPTEKCDSVYENNVSVSFSSPRNGDTILGTVTLKSSAKAPTGVSTVEYFIDGSFIGDASSSPYAVDFDTTSTSSGSHKLTVRVTDKKGNKGSSSINVTINNGSVTPEAPQVNSVDSPTSSNHQIISGSKPSKTAVFINGDQVTSFTDSESWAQNVSLSVGTNTFTIMVRDEDGNESESVTIEIVREP